jgi:acyl carrier protein phosphodiesterase
VHFINTELTRDHTFLDHYHFLRFISIAKDIIIRHVHSSFKVDDKVTYELLSSFIVIVVKQIKEVLNEVPKKAVNQSMSKSWLQQYEILVILDA